MTYLVRGGAVLVDPAAGTVLNDGAVLVEGARVAAAGPFADLSRTHPGATVIGGPADIVMPGLIDAHSHGRGLSPVQKGVLYDYLENAFLEWSSMVYLPNDLCAALSAVRHLRYGATTIHHTGWNDDTPNANAEARMAVKAYADCGIRLVYSPAVRNRNRFVVGEQEFLTTLPDDLRAFCTPFTQYDAQKIEDDNMALFEDLHSSFNDDMSRIVFGPSWAHGTTEGFLARIRDRAAALGGLPIHIHTLQTPHQRAYGFKTWGKSLVSYLDDQGLIGPNTTLGHAVWLSDADIALLAERRANTTHHASCNLHVRNGISPAYAMLKAGVNVAMGIDDKSINDDDDPFMELRLIHMLARVPGFDMEHDPALPATEILSMGTTRAARTLGFEGQLGTLAPGQLADIVVLDTAEMTRDPWQSSRLPLPDLLVLRAKGQHVRHVIVNGRHVMDNGRITTIDVDALHREVTDYVTRHEAKPADPARIDKMKRLKPYFFAWHRELLKHLDVSEPHYMMNGRR
jgi:5-methylthioadenosine/S-adenosylhomocysteine deaminase